MRDDDPLVGGVLGIFYPGDPYLEIAKLVHAVPPDATEKTHGPQRKLSKARALAATYGSLKTS